MRSISVLDCTLRDGGYINDWNFGDRTITSIIGKLEQSHIDIVEVGFLTKKSKGSDYSLYSTIKEANSFIPQDSRQVMYVGMIAIGEKEIHPCILEEYSGWGLEGIRLTFHQNEIDKAFEWARIIQSKGYKVFMQPVGTVFYSDAELLELVSAINELNPYAFYIVDTLGSMYRNKLMYMFYLINENLSENIKVGFHPHNNLQLAFSNAQELIRIQTHRDIIIDASVYGMGRGAGNLPTELITQYINENIEKKYDVTTILDVYDEHISLIKEKYEWGYTIPYDIAASYVCHPNYASYLMNRQTLTMKDIEKIITLIPKRNRAIYKKSLIEELYVKYQDQKIDDHFALEKIKTLISGKKILILAPGKSLSSERKKIDTFVEQNHPYIISVNFLDRNFDIQACYVSNHKRLSGIKEEYPFSNATTIIASSNLLSKILDNSILVDYYSYLNEDDIVFDNAGLMLLKLLEKCNVREVTMAGFDGFKTRYDDNYYNELITFLDKDELTERQNRIKIQLEKIGHNVKLNFLTKSIYEVKDV